MSSGLSAENVRYGENQFHAQDGQGCFSSSLVFWAFFAIYYLLPLGVQPKRIIDRAIHKCYFKYRQCKYRFLDVDRDTQVGRIFVEQVRSLVGEQPQCVDPYPSLTSDVTRVERTVTPHLLSHPNHGVRIDPTFLPQPHFEGVLEVKVWRLRVDNIMTSLDITVPNSLNQHTYFDDQPTASQPRFTNIPQSNYSSHYVLLPRIFATARGTISGFSQFILDCSKTVAGVGAAAVCWVTSRSATLAHKKPAFSEEVHTLKLAISIIEQNHIPKDVIFSVSLSALTRLKTALYTPLYEKYNMTSQQCPRLAKRSNSAGSRALREQGRNVRADSLARLASTHQEQFITIPRLVPSHQYKGLITSRWNDMWQQSGQKMLQSIPQLENGKPRFPN